MDVKKRFFDDADAGKSENKDFINKISDECLLKIFTSVPVLQRLNLDLVCVKWKKVNKLAWRDVKTIDYNAWQPGQRSTQSEIKNLLKHAGNNFKELAIIQNLLHSCQPNILSVINLSCKNLVQLELNFSINFTDEYDFVDAFSNMKKLKIIKIMDLKQRQIGASTSKVFLCIFDNLPKTLESIFVGSSHIWIDSPPSFSKVLKKFDSLRCLTLRRWKLDVKTMKVISHLRFINHLDLKNSTLGNGEFFIPYLINLEHLDLEGTNSIVPKLLMDITNKCKNLKHLNIASSEVNREALGHLKNLQNLRTLIINRVPINDYRLSQLSMLKRLDCSSCTRITDAAIKRILIRCPGLEYLDISNTMTTVVSLLLAANTINKRINQVNLCVVTNKEQAYSFAETQYNERCKHALSRLEIIIRENWADVFNTDDFIERYFDESQRCDCPVHRMKCEIKIRQNNQRRNHIVEMPCIENLINNLSDDCLANIFKFVPPIQRLQMKLVCKKWLSANEVAWYDVKKLDINNRSLFNTSKVGKLLQECGHYLTELNITGFECETRLVPMIREYCDQLKKLDLFVRLKRWDWLHYVNFLSQMKQLNYIKLTDVTYRFTQQDCSRVYKTIVDSLNDDVEEIHFKLIDKRLDLVPEMFDKFNKLHHLTLNGWTLDQENLEIIFQKSSLVHLDLNSCQLPSHGLLSIGNLINLEYLNISSIGNIETRIFIKNISKLGNLKTLIMNRIYNADSIDQIVYGLNKLEVLECANCAHNVTDIGVMKVLRNCHELKTLSVSNSGISGESLACAVTQAKNKKNNVVLKMLVSHQVFDEFRDSSDDDISSSRLHVLPFLRIEVTDRDEDEDSESQESDYYEYDVSDEEDNNNFNFFAMQLGRLFHNNQHDERGWHVVENRNRHNGSANANNNIRRIDKDGNLVDGNGRRVDNQGHILDDDGNRIDGYADFIGDDEW